MDVERGNSRERYRGKLYALSDDSAWRDMGTGFVQVTDHKEVAKRRLVLQDESSSEILYDQPVAETVIAYQLQVKGDRQAIIVWEDAFSKDWALSFQDPGGANEIYDIIYKVPEIQVLPIPKFGELIPLSRLLQGIPLANREAIAAECLNPEFIEGLLCSFHLAEDMGSEADLNALWHIAKGIFLLSNQKLTERYLQRDLYEDIMGMLEYDDGLPEAKRIAHRQVLKETVRFTEVVTFEDTEMLERIHLNFRLQYLKDRVLPKHLDDQAFMCLTAQIHGNISSILEHLKSRTQLLGNLFAKILHKDVTSLAFLQDACRLAKNSIPMQECQVLYETMVERNLFEVLSQFLDDPPAVSSSISPDSRSNPRHMIVEILQLSAVFDSTHLRRFLTTSTESGWGARLLRLLINMMMTETDQGVQSQIADMLKSVMNPTNLQETERERSLDVLYVGSHQGTVLEELTAPLRNLNGKVRIRDAFGLQMVCELVAFAVAKHGYRARSYLLTKRPILVPQALRLVTEKPRWLQLAPLRLLSAMVRSEDDAYHRYIIQNSLFRPVFISLSDSLQPPSIGWNLVVSAVLELLEYISAQDIKSLIDHICKNHGAVMELHRVQIRTFDELIKRHRQNLESEVVHPNQFASGSLAGTAVMGATDDKDALTTDVVTTDEAKPNSAGTQPAAKKHKVN